MLRSLKLMARFFWLFLLMLFVLKSNGQQYAISGKIADSLGQPVKEATIVLAQPQSGKIITTVQSTGEGIFVIRAVNPGQYNLVITHISFRRDSLNVSITNTDINLTNIVLTQLVKGLKDVVVEANKSFVEQKIDRTVYNVENSVSLAGATALDALTKLPGVRVVNGSGIALAGKGQVMVLIDDRKIFLSGDDLLNFLKAMPAIDVVRIEVIPNPPAKYEAAGNFGLINIVTKKRKTQGFGGTVNSAYSQNYYPSGNAGTQLNYNKGKLSINTTLNGSENNYYEITNPTVFYPLQTWDQHRTSKNISKNIFGRLAVDYQLNKRQLLGFAYLYSFREVDAHENSVTNVNDAWNDKTDSLISAKNDIHRNSNSHALNFYYERLLDTTGRKIFFDAGYFHLNNNVNSYFFNNSYLVNGYPLSSSYLNSTGPLKATNYTSQIDVIVPGRVMNLSFGGKLSFVETKSAVDFFTQSNTGWLYNDNLSNAFNYKENVQAIYISGNKKLHKWEVQAGLRGENTQTTGYSVTYNQAQKNNYFKIFPSIFINYKLNKNSLFAFSWSKRLNRPNYWYLNPFKQFVSPYFYYEGNPFLQPTYNNGFQLSYTYKNRFVSKVFADIVNNVFDQILLTDTATKITRLTRLNYYSQRNIGFSQSVSIATPKWLENYTSFSLYYISTKSAVNYAAGQAGWGADVTTSTTLTLNNKKTCFAGFDFTYNFPQVSGISHFKAWYQLAMAVRTLWLKKKLTVAVNATDLFRTSRTRFYSITNNVKTQYDNYFDARSLRLSLTYRFGKTENSKRQGKESNTDERKRANQ